MSELRGHPAAAVLIVSPHLDDAALSCAALLEAPQSAHVLTVFGGAPAPARVGWSERMTGFGDSDVTMRARHEENSRAFAGSPHTIESLDLLDEDYLDGARDDKDGRKLVGRLRRWSVEHAVGTVALPAGAGRRRGPLRTRLEWRIGARGGALPHEDHLWVRDAALPAALAGASILLYEELPYLWGGSAERAVHRVAKRARARVEEIVVAIDRTAKARRIAAYTSQLALLPIDERRLEDPVALPPTERYWRLTRP